MNLKIGFLNNLIYVEVTSIKNRNKINKHINNDVYEIKVTRN